MSRKCDRLLHEVHIAIHNREWDLWSVLNETSQSAKSSTLAHRSEILDDHMNHSNWKKLIGMGMFILPSWIIPVDRR